MDGHCFGCATKFGFFTKEHGCHKCGHAYCKACLPHKSVIPSSSSSKPQSVCSSCFRLLQQPKTDTVEDNLQNEGRYSPPENFKKRVAALHQKQQQQQHHHHHASPSSEAPGQGTTQGASSSAQAAAQAAKYKKLAPQDRDIAMRLDRLQEERKKKQKPPLSQTEIEERLRKLRDLPPDNSQQNVYQPPSNKSLEDQYDDLLDQMTEEAALDARLAGTDIPEHPESRHQAPCQSHTRTGGEPLIPSEDDMRQLVEDAKKLMADQAGATSSQAENNQAHGNTGASQGTGEPGISEEAKRLAEEASRLMEEARSEVTRDEEVAKRDAERYAEISGRLAQLQNQQPVSGLATSGCLEESDEEDEEKASQKLIQQLLEESKLDERVESDGFEVPSKKIKPQPRSNTKCNDRDSNLSAEGTRPPSESHDPDELPWCCICNEDAVLRCLDCEGDLYCKRCFREEHKEFGIESHTIKPYKAPKAK